MQSAQSLRLIDQFLFLLRRSEQSARGAGSNIPAPRQIVHARFPSYRGRSLAEAALSCGVSLECEGVAQAASGKRPSGQAGNSL